MRNNDWTGALADLKPMIDKRQTLTWSDRLPIIRFAAECYQAAGQPDKSKPFYLEWLQFMPNDATALNNLAYLLAEDMNDPNAARQYSQRAYDVGRKFSAIDPMILDTHGWVLTLCGGPASNEGLAILTQVVDAHSDFLDARFHLAMAYLKRNRTSDAIRQLTTAQEQIKTMEDNKVAVRPQLKTAIQSALDKSKPLSSISH